MKSVGQMLMPVCRLWNGHGRRHLQTFGLSFNTDMYSSSSIRLGPLCTSLHNTCQKPLTLLCVRYLRTSPWRPNVEVSSSIQKNVQGLMVKRPARKKIPAIKGQDEEVMYKVQAYATAEEYGLDELSAAIKRQGLYAVMQLPKDAENVLYVRAKYELDETLREIFFFSEGCAVFWNMPETERNEVLRFVSQFSESEYSPSLIEQEVEDMDFVHTDKSPGLVGGTIQIRESVEGTAQIEESVDADKAVLDKFAFSNALSLSVKLGVWEASLDKFVESIQPVLQDMKDGRKLRMSRHVALQKTGELFTLRHLINLSSDLLDPPDFYWDREQLETLYQQTFSYLNIPKRTKVMNEKLNHCCELTDLVISHLNDNHHVRLEWMIILLILVEVVFEVIHYIEKYTVQPAAISSEESTTHADQPR